MAPPVPFLPVVRVLIGLLILSFSVPATAGPASVSGRVVDAGGAPIAGARVTLEAGGTALRAESTRDGQFEFVTAEPGPFTLVVEAAGYASVRRELAAPFGAQEIALRPAGFAEALTVTAARTVTAQADTPASVVVLSREELKATPAVTLDDALRQVPGFSLFRRTGSRAANPTTQGAFLRGVGASGASRALILEDGIALNDAFGGWVQWGRVPRAALGRVEVLRGGASDVHGSGALAGVVHLVRQPVAAHTLVLDSSYGGQDTSQVSLLAGGRRGRFSAALAAETFRTGGYVLVDEADRGPVDVEANSRYTTVDLTLAHEPSHGPRAFLRGSLFDETRGNGTPLQTNATDLRELRAGVDGRAGQNAFSLRAHAGDQEYDQTFTAIAADRASETLTRSQHVPADSAGVSGHWTRTLGARAALAAGASWRRVGGTSEEDVFTRPGAPPTETATGGRQRQVSAFVEALLAPAANVTVTASARLDGWRNEAEAAASAASSRSQDALSPRLSVLWRATSALAVSASAYQAFRAPTLNELYRPFRVGNVLTIGNEGLGAEHLGGGEAGLRLTRGAAALRATGFWMEVRDTVGNITLSSTPTLITRQRQNLGRSRSRGLEVDAEWRPRPSLSVSGGYLFADATVLRFRPDPSLEGLRVPQVPRHLLTLTGRWQPAGGWLASAQARWSASQYDDDRNTFLLEPFWALDALVSRALGSKVELFAAGENLLGDRWDVGRTPLRTIGPPRSLRAGLRVDVSAR
jgi:outer membrane receptor protein involved in Fe transport